MGHTRGGGGPHVSVARAGDRTATAARNGPLRQATAAAPRRDLGAGRPRPSPRRDPIRIRRAPRTHGLRGFRSPQPQAHFPAFKATANRLLCPSLLKRERARLPGSPPMPCPALTAGELASSDGGCMVSNPLKTLSFVFLPVLCIRISGS
jgi:hypothetical protein